MKPEEELLDEWPKLDDAFGRPRTLILGNGLSQHISNKFSYKSLRSEAIRRGLLSPASQQLFTGLNNTENFEEILDALAKAHIIATTLGHQNAAINQHLAEIKCRRDEIRLSLLEAVKAVHLSAADFTKPRRDQLGGLLSAFSMVFTVNYDLLPYWSLMENPGSGDFADYFWNPNGDGSTLFDPANTRPSTARRTMLHYLHGASHLWTNGAAEGKWRSEGDLRDLDTLWQAYPDRLPLFVSEGSTAAKQLSIARSPYLTFALRELQLDSNDAVLFGVGLSDQDLHIAEAIAGGPPRKIAVSIRPKPNPDEVALAKAQYTKLLHGRHNRNSIHFFAPRRTHLETASSTFPGEGVPRPARVAATERQSTLISHSREAV